MRSRPGPAILLLLASVVGCASDPDATPGVIAVPADARTITDAIAKAGPGDLVLVSPGVYRESVVVHTAGVTVRGTERNSVIIDGEFRRANGIVVTAPEVTVENVTVRNNTQNGVLVTGMSDEKGAHHAHSDYRKLDPNEFPPLQGFRVRYVSAHNNGLYGVYAFDAQSGVIEHSFASGSSDSGFYVGQCKPCHVTVRANHAERNAVGFEGANASHGLVVTGNRFTGNRIGIASMTDYREAFVPQEDAVFAGNLIGDNAEKATPAHAEGGWGVGIAISGGSDNLVRANRIVGNPVAGILITSADDIAPNGNRAVDNLLDGNGIGVVYAASARARGRGNCLSGNQGSFDAAPAALTSSASCPDGHPTGLAGVPPPAADAPPGLSFRKVATPGRQPTMPGPVDRLPAPWTAPEPPDVTGVTVPGPDLLAFES